MFWGDTPPNPLIFSFHPHALLTAYSFTFHRFALLNLSFLKICFRSTPDGLIGLRKHRGIGEFLVQLHAFSPSSLI